MESSELVGWEYLPDNKPGIKTVDLSSLMDPYQLAENAADLNLKLMRWRQMPSLPIETFKELKCLLIGGGTLGCQVGRSLVSWGLHNITVVDNGHVSYSNPTRQCLYTFEDAKNHRLKVEALPMRLKEIHP